MVWTIQCSDGIVMELDPAVVNQCQYLLKKGRQRESESTQQTEDSGQPIPEKKARQSEGIQQDSAPKQEGEREKVEEQERKRKKAGQQGEAEREKVEEQEEERKTAGSGKQEGERQSAEQQQGESKNADEQQTATQPTPQEKMDSTEDQEAAAMEIAEERDREEAIKDEKTFTQAEQEGAAGEEEKEKEKEKPIQVNVSSRIMKHVIDWGVRHKYEVPEEIPNKRMVTLCSWDDAFVVWLYRQDRHDFFQLLQAADHLQMNSLLDTMSYHISHDLKGKSAEEMTAYFTAPGRPPEQASHSRQ